MSKKEKYIGVGLIKDYVEVITAVFLTGMAVVTGYNQWQQYTLTKEHFYELNQGYLQSSNIKIMFGERSDGAHLLYMELDFTNYGNMPIKINPELIEYKLVHDGKVRILTATAHKTLSILYPQQVAEKYNLPPVIVSTMNINKLLSEHKLFVHVLYKYSEPNYHDRYKTYDREFQIELDDFGNVYQHEISNNDKYV